MNRRKIVVISGSGRTGSTLLSLLLTQHKEVFNLGQLRDLWSAWAADAPCTCGRTLHACPVYGVAVPAVFGPDAASGVDRMRRDMAAFFAAAGRIRDWSETAAVARLAQTHAPVLDRLGRLLEALQQAAGADVFVDASKSPEMALAFSLTEGTDLRVLNLARDPRAVAVSWRERAGKLAAGVKYGRVWAGRQRALGDWSKALGERFMLVRYEAFAARPRETVAAIEQWAGLPPMPALFGAPDRAAISWERQHLFPPANERVLAERRTEVVIAPAESWRQPRHRLTRLLALAASHPQGWRYVRGAGPRESGRKR